MWLIPSFFVFRCETPLRGACKAVLRFWPVCYAFKQTFEQTGQQGQRDDDNDAHAEAPYSGISAVDRIA